MDDFFSTCVVTLLLSAALPSLPLPFPCTFPAVATPHPSPAPTTPTPRRDRSDLVLETTTDSGTGAGTLAFDVVVGSSAVIGRRAVIRVLVVAEVCTNSLAGSPLNSGAASFIGDNNVVFDSSNSEIDVVISIPNANGRYVGAINVGAELFQVGSCQFPVSAATCAVGNSELGFSLPYASALDASCYDSLETGIVDARYNGGVAGAASEIARYTYVGTLTYPERIVTTRNGVDYEVRKAVTWCRRCLLCCCCWFFFY